VCVSYVVAVNGISSQTRSIFKVCSDCSPKKKKKKRRELEVPGVSVFRHDPTVLIRRGGTFEGNTRGLVLQYNCIHFRGRGDNTVT